MVMNEPGGERDDGVVLGDLGLEDGKPAASPTHCGHGTQRAWLAGVEVVDLHLDRHGAFVVLAAGEHGGAHREVDQCGDRAAVHGAARVEMPFVSSHRGGCVVVVGPGDVDIEKLSQIHTPALPPHRSPPADVRHTGSVIGLLRPGRLRRCCGSGAPDGFGFVFKLPRAITHEHHLRDVAADHRQSPEDELHRPRTTAWRSQMCRDGERNEGQP
jgi:hypothetical protein